MNKLFKISLMMVAIVTMLSSCRRVYDEPWEYPAVVIEERIPLRGFDGIALGQGMRIHISKGPYQIIAKGDQNDVADLEAAIDSDNMLQIRYVKNRRRYAMDLYVTMPSASYFEFSGGAWAEINGFNSPHLCIAATGGADVLVNADADIWDLLLANGATMDIYGRGNKLILDASGGSRLLGRDLYINHADIDLSGASDMVANVRTNIWGNASGASSVKYYGNPYVDVVLSGSSWLKRM